MSCQLLSNVMDRFRLFGVRFVLDNFRAQHTNIFIFAHLKVACVKLDRAPLSHLDANSRSQIPARDLAPFNS